MGGGKRKTKSNGGGSKAGARNGRHSPSASARSRLFVDGGFLDDWNDPNSSSGRRNPEGNCKLNFKSANFDRSKGSASGSKIISGKCVGNAFGYSYPSVDTQEGLQLEPLGNETNVKNGADYSHPIVLVDSKDTQIIAYVDQTSSSHATDVVYNYDYGSSFVLGDGLHKGLGFYDEPDASQSGAKVSSKQIDYQERPCINSSSFEMETDADREGNCEPGSEMAEEPPEDRSTPKKNSGFLSIGGLRLYTQDISDEESDEDEVVSPDEGSLEFSDANELDESSEGDRTDASDELSDSDSNIDEEVAEDYLDGIGGSENVLAAEWLVEQDLDESDDESSSSSCLNETVEKLGGIALREASREYGMMKPQSRKKNFVSAQGLQTSPLDDLFLVKDSRIARPKKKQIPRSWPLEEQKSKYSRRYPGEKKKHRKEMIATKRRQRMLRRGVDPRNINLKLEEIVLEGIDMFSFPPMHPRDCSQVQRLAAIYRLQSGCQGSGKKRFVTVTRTQHTCMPSSSDRIRLEKLIGPSHEDAGFCVNEVSNVRSGDKNRKKKNAKGGVSEKKQSRTKGSFANQPVSFISSGVMQSETVEVKAVDPEEAINPSTDNGVANSSNFGAFEVHTKGFGSKMMAKMGFIEGRGLGKDGQGMAKPIEVVKRPKSLGLGVQFSETAEDQTRASTQMGNSAKKKHHQPQTIGSFEKHTKGFGSKMMAKMGFVEGMGLGKDSRGIVNPLVPVRLPKSRGLGANG